MLIKPGLTMRQIGARYKLCLSRFDRDRQAREHIEDTTKDAPTPCSCGCLNHLESWIRVCTEPKTVDRIKLARVRIATMLSNERPLEGVIAPLLAGQDQMFLWRANWQESHMVALADCYKNRTMTDQQWRAAQRALRGITEELISASLDLHGLRKENAVGWDGRKYNPRESNKIRKERDAVDRAFLAQFHKVTTFFPHLDPNQAHSVPTLHPTPAPYRRPHNLQIPQRQLKLVPMQDEEVDDRPPPTPQMPNFSFSVSPAPTSVPDSATTATPAGTMFSFLTPARMVGARRMNSSSAPTRQHARGRSGNDVAEVPSRSETGKHRKRHPRSNTRQRPNTTPPSQGEDRRRSVNGQNSAQRNRRRSERTGRPP